MNKSWALLAGALALMAAAPAYAGYQTCDGHVVGDYVSQCPNGEIPIYHSGSPPGGESVPDDLPPPSEAGVSSLFGVWHTSVPGAVWSSPSAIPGYDRMHISPGAKAGDLTIDPSGRYSWNSYGGKVGHWIQGDSEYPIVLIDNVEHKRWKVGFDRDHLVVWDGYVYYTGTR